MAPPKSSHFVLLALARVLSLAVAHLMHVIVCPTQMKAFIMVSIALVHGFVLVTVMYGIAKISIHMVRVALACFASIRKNYQNFY